MAGEATLKEAIQKAKEAVKLIQEKGEEVFPIIEIKVFVQELASQVGTTGKNEALGTEVA